ncbi:MAG: fused MFS/spermidine synthase [Thermoanaerobaculia bacterium]
MPARVRLLLAACFLSSGGTAVVYEVLWSRHLALFFGSTTEAVGVVLAVFMLGLGAGGHLLGPRVDGSASPVRLYGLLEIAIGLWAFATPLLLRGAAGAWVAAASRLEPGPAVATLLRALLAAVVLLPPAMAMGGTLPAVVRGVAGNDRAAGDVALFYGLNVVGAVGGALLAGFVLPEVLGEQDAMLLAGLVNVLVGAVALAAARRAAPAEPAPETPREGLAAALRHLAGAPGGRFVLAGLFVSGLGTMVAEVVFVRILGLVFGVSAYSFSLVLAVFLAGLGLGALAAGALARLRKPEPADFAVVQVAVAALTALALAGMPLVPRLVAWVRQWPELTFGEVLAAKAAIASAFLLPLAVVAGLGVPVLIGALTGEPGRLGRLVGDAVLVNTAGTVAGSLLAGFVLVPSLGTEGTLRAAFALAAATATWGLLVPGTARGRRLAGIATLAASLPVLLHARWPATLFLESDTDASPMPRTSRVVLEARLAGSPNELLFLREGRNATVAVAQTSESRVLFVGAHPDASDGDDMPTQLFLSVVALGAHPAPSDVLVVGYGSGVTVEAALRVPGVRRVDGVEIEKAVLEASPLFGHVNRGAERDPRARFVLDDARGFLSATRRSWDVILSEPSNPWRAGVASLFTTDFYRAAKARLRPGGLFAQWLQLYSTDEACVKLVLRSLAASFAEVQVWWLDAGNVVVLAADAPIRVPRGRMDALLDGPFREDRIRHARVGTTAEFYARFLLDTRAVLAFAGEGPLHTDDRPLLEFEAPRAVFRSGGQEAARLVAEKLSSRSLVPPLAGEPPPEEALWAGLSEMLHAAGRGPDAEAAARHAASLGDGALGRVRLAALRLEAKDPDAARPLLAEANEARERLSPDLRRDERATTGLLHVATGNAADAGKAFEEAGTLEGPHGVRLVELLAAQGRAADAIRLAERLLRAARLEGAVGSPEVSRLYVALARVNEAAPDGRIAELVRTLPLPGAGFPLLPRLVVLARLFDRLGRPAESLSAARAAREAGLVDVGTHLVEWRALVALGRLGEADRLGERLSRLSPSAFGNPVVVKVPR